MGNLRLNDAVIAVTYKCNSKCSMCNIWKESPKNELAPEKFSKIPAGLKDINITGGEPFLRNDLVEIIENINSVNPKARLIFSSNGFATEKIVYFMKKIKKINPNTGIGISLDGIDEMHSKLRGIDNAYSKVISTIIDLKKAGIKDIRIGFTGSNQNIQHLSKIYDIARLYDIEFTLSIVHNSENYFNIDTNLTPDFDDLEKELNYVINNEFKSINPRRLLRTFYMRGILKFQMTGKRPLACQALKDFFYMDPEGYIFPCNILNKPVGNIRENDFETIWNSAKTDKLRKYCENCNDCWMVCTAKSSIRREFLSVAKEIIPAKIKTLYPKLAEISH